MGIWHYYRDERTSRNAWGSVEVRQHLRGLADEYFGTLLRERLKRVGEDAPHAFLANLVVLPAWQGKGVGTSLIRDGLQEVDHLALPCWADASPSGIKLYRKYGWSDVTTLQFDLAPYGGSSGDVHTTVCMLRHAQKGKPAVGNTNGVND